jgi:hypothetical protein
MYPRNTEQTISKKASHKIKKTQRSTKLLSNELERPQFEINVNKQIAIAITDKPPITLATNEFDVMTASRLSCSGTPRLTAGTERRMNSPSPKSPMAR